MRTALILLITFLATGCASPWEKSFQSNPELRGQKFPPTPNVHVRTVEYERLKKFTDEEHQRRVNSTTAPVDLPPEQKMAMKNRLLQALQIPERGDDAVIVGTSQFTSPEVLKPDDPNLAAFAKKLGADTVVVSTAYLGKASRIDTVPVTSYSTDTYITHYRRNGNRISPAYTTVNSSSTAWVPVPVTEDQYLHQAFFLRREKTSGHE
jgi:hypothetical protein